VAKSNACVAVKHMNRLAREKSPYLLQHAHNPVDWYPWGSEAFDAARLTSRPIFLSIGYSTCHWCHVMERESFENPAVAELLNRDFIAVKVDREERPDVDRVYMRFVQATTGSGGWPMSVWLTPDLKPFFGGTYFPPESRYGRAGFVDLLSQVARAWRDDRAAVIASADDMVRQLAPPAPGPGATTAIPDERVVRHAVSEFSAACDPIHGGFGGAPKFPRPSELLFLLSEARRTGDDRAKTMAVATLEAMAAGGMRDHIGGGFHRYSVDGAWRVPHFEKMLYDQAQLIDAYVEAIELERSARFAGVVEDTIAYVMRTLTDHDGGFLSAEDADSIPVECAGDAAPRKTEGAFYLWRFDEVGDLLGADADIVRARFGMRPDGNAPFDPHDEFTGKNLLYEAKSIADIADERAVSTPQVAASLARARQVLFDAREHRPRPHLDDKVIAAWNGLMIAALAKAGRVLSRPDWLACAARGASFVRTRMWDAETGVLHRRYRDGEVATDGFAEDYACVIWGALELAAAGVGKDWCDWARTLQARQDALFGDEIPGGWFATRKDAPDVILRLKDDYDGAEPASSSVSAGNLLRFAALTGDVEWRRRAEETFMVFSSPMTARGRSVPMMLANLSTYLTAVSK
jgi:uncharacterized protein YyaL (SSP411 family)